MKEKIKITIEMIHDDGEEFSTTVTGEGVTLDKVAQLMSRALLGQGFTYDSVKKLIDCEI
ncbi:hypothetical protein [uncultured Mediterranean phage uvMED]|nr:hypothetical protein [uncultured Mediterranean phage uvMED]BAR22605.1 hypothetical protein [uncultured Mediterranean phage uvMED]